MGDAMVGLTAPAARVFLFPSRLAATALLDSGWYLFEAAVRWATGTALPEQQLSSSEGPSAFTQIYTVVGSHITLAAVDRVTPIRAYSSSNPIIVAGDESSEYLYATFTSPLTGAEMAQMREQGAHFDALVSQSEDLQAYRITTLTGVNTLASAFQSISSKFHNLTPLKLQEKIARADEPKRQGSAKLVSLRCGVQVTPTSCLNALSAQLTSVEHSHDRNVIGYATESQIQALAALSALASGHEVPLSLSTLAEARVATYVEVLHQSLTFPYDPSQSRSGGGILIGIYDSGVDPGHPDFFDLSSATG